MPPLRRCRFGVPGLDTILHGGLPAGRLYLLEGQPGSGKTTLSLQFLREGVRQGERCLYVTLSETAEELREVAGSHGWDLKGIDLFELSSVEEVLGEGRNQSVFHSWEVELGETVRLIKQEVERLEPVRVVFDSLSELRLLAQDPLRYRRQVLALKQFFAPRSATVLFIDDLTSEGRDRDTHLHSISHGVISLERFALEFGAARRRLQIQKMRGATFLAGYHDLSIQTGGVEVYPRLVAAEHHIEFGNEPTLSGVPQLDALMGGGFLRGTSTLLTGPAGTGKTTLALQYIGAACARGERCHVYEFDERIDTLVKRAEAMGVNLVRFMEDGLLEITQVDPAEMPPGEFAWNVFQAVQEKHCTMVVIDSLNGYLSAMPQEKHLLLQMHELLAFLNQSGVTTFLINPQFGLVGSMDTGPLNVSYVADAVILFRFFESQGRIRKAISVIKNRSGKHEDTIRELFIDSKGLRVGEPLADFRGVLTGTPEFLGNEGPLLETRDA
ncbi:ATPase domain-containing protein [Dyella jiangningensis]|uniref:non-specific serine/threonine protein kinase n=1 Tax=Dyella jiangningensis TaxID=1379159 RepID=A0A328P4C5_9GAMM|nr:ATPase domain-containing protein [Dyella jiangningensis]RAO76161.1 circadian clock protein KaiC [Dyella jiangningensis]